MSRSRQATSPRAVRSVGGPAPGRDAAGDHLQRGRARYGRGRGAATPDLSLPARAWTVVVQRDGTLSEASWSQGWPGSHQPSSETVLVAGRSSLQGPLPSRLSRSLIERE